MGFTKKENSPAHSIYASVVFKFNYNDVINIMASICFKFNIYSFFFSLNKIHEFVLYALNALKERPRIKCFIFGMLLMWYHKFIIDCNAVNPIVDCYVIIETIDYEIEQVLWF